MTTPAPESDGDRERIDISRAQQWVLHHVMVSRCERAREERRTPPWWAVDVIEKLEDGVVSFTPFEAWRLRTDLDEYARDAETPPEEADSARAIAEEIDRTFESPPATLRE